VGKLRDDSSTGAAGGPGAPAGAGAGAGGPELTVPPGAAGERLDRFIATHVGSRAAAERAVEAGVLVDGRPRPKSYRLEGGERVQLVALPAPAPAAPPPAPAIAFEDEHLAVVDKPAGLVVHPGAGRRGDTLVDALAGVVAGGDPARPGIVHRLDRDTSGLLVVAKSDEAHARLSDLVRRRGLERRYVALVSGRPASRSGRIEAPIGRDRGDPTRISLDTDTPRDAVTHFEVERLLRAHALLCVRLETGRMHQIRVHLAAIDLPVVGDSVYGLPEPALGRQFLHAARLGLVHPFTGERLDLESPLPADLEAYLSGLTPLP
jgi:23S rRNA pseudouridine1911/1915/1917 synthase